MDGLPKQGVRGDQKGRRRQPSSAETSDTDSSNTPGRRLASKSRSAKRPRKPPERKSRWAASDSDASTAVDDSENAGDAPQVTGKYKNLRTERQERRGRYRARRAENTGKWRQIWTINGFLDPWLSGILGKVFGWWGFRRFMKETPWMIMLGQVFLMAWIGTTCLEPVDNLLGGQRFYATIGTFSLGGWGYCASGTCTYKFPYSLELELTLDVPLFSDAVLLPYLCMALTLGSGILLFFFFYLLMERWRDHRWTQFYRSDIASAQRQLEEGRKASLSRMPEPSRPFILSKAGFVATQFELRCQNSQRLEMHAELERPFWRPWQILLSLTMWIAFGWNLVVFIGLEIWMRLTLATAEQGDDLKYWLMGVSSSWVIMAHIYRSYWVYGSVKKQQNEDDGSDWSSDEGD